MMEAIGFGTVAAGTLLAAIYVVRSQNLIHAVLWLGVALLATAALYAMLGASFLAGVQVLVYVGGVITLMIFGLMITRRHEGIVVQAETMKPARAALTALALFGILAAAILRTPGLDTPLVSPAPRPLPAAALGRALLTEHILAFEAISFLLLAAIIGAIVIARKRDPGTVVPPRFAAAVPIVTPPAELREVPQ